jgi:hypothetical protein
VLAAEKIVKFLRVAGPRAEARRQAGSHQKRQPLAGQVTGSLASKTQPA